MLTFTARIAFIKIFVHRETSSESIIKINKHLKFKLSQLYMKYIEYQYNENIFTIYTNNNTNRVLNLKISMITLQFLI